MIEKINCPKCDGCGRELPEDTEKVADPFILEVCREKEMVFLCDDCYQQRIDDV